MLQLLLQQLKTVSNYTNFLLFVIIYLSFFLDNVLLTVVVPIIPDYLFSNDDLDTIHNNPSDSYLGPNSLSPLQRKYEELESDNGPFGALLASKAFVQLACTPLIGYIIEIFGCYIPLLLGSCNLLIASLLFAYGNSYGVLVLARALHGTSSAAIAVSGMSILAETVPKELRSKVMPLSFGGIALGVLIGYPLGGAVYQSLGKEAPFLMIAALISLSIILQLVTLEDNQTTEIKVDKINCNQWINLLKDTQIFITTFAICICTSIMAILESCVPIWLLATLNPPPSRWQLGAVFIPDSFGYFLGSNFAGLLPVAPWRVALSALVIAGLSCCALPQTTTMKQLILPHFGVGLGVGAVDAALVPLLANLVDRRGGTRYGPIYALQQAFVSLAYAFGPLLAGQAVDLFGFPWLMRFIGFLNLLFCPLLIELENVEESRIGLLTEDLGAISYSSLEKTSTCLTGESFD